MRSLISLLLMLAALWHLTGGGAMDLADAFLAIGAAWFVSLFIAD
jgi:hypothetical protein